LTLFIQKMKPKIEVSHKKWHVIYTRSRAEKKVHIELGLNNIESFLPLQKKLRQWKDRKKWVEVPLMSGYCFVNITRKEYDLVLQTNNVVCYVMFEGKAAIVPNDQINYLKQMLCQSDFEVNVSHEDFKPGQKVEIIAGQMIGMRGELVGPRGKHRFILRLSQINTAFMIEIQSSNLKKVELDL
jgi:transcription antitermination factor NusG